ncbi:hypothetical protein Tco_0766363 [Tanacetum coccineum]
MVDFVTSRRKELAEQRAQEYVVPTGRVVVPTGRYVVPAGKVIIIVSPGRLSLVPTGRILSPVDGVFDGAFGGVGDEEVVVGEGVVRFSSSSMRSTNSCFGGMMVSLIFLKSMCGMKLDRINGRDRFEEDEKIRIVGRLYLILI